MEYRVFTLHQRPDLVKRVDEIAIEAWPEFLRYGDTPDWRHLYDTLSGYLCNAEGQLMAVGRTAPIVWNGGVEDLPRINDIIVRGVKCVEGKRRANTFSALAVMVAKAFRGRGLSALVLREMRAWRPPRIALFDRARSADFEEPLSPDPDGTIRPLDMGGRIAL